MCSGPQSGSSAEDASSETATSPRARIRAAATPPAYADEPMPSSTTRRVVSGTTDAHGFSAASVSASRPSTSGLRPRSAAKPSGFTRGPFVEQRGQRRIRYIHPVRQMLCRIDDFAQDLL